MVLFFYRLGRAGARVLPALAELVRRLPKEVPLQVGALTVDQSALQLEAETSSFESVEKVRQALDASPVFSDVAVSDARAGTVPNQILFRISLHSGIE